MTISNPGSIRLDCQPWEVKLILRLRQLRERQSADHILVDLANLQLYPVGNAETLEKPNKNWDCVETSLDV